MKIILKYFRPQLKSLRCFLAESCRDKTRPHNYAVDASALGTNADSRTARSWRPICSRMSMRDGRVQGGTVGVLLLLLRTDWAWEADGPMPSDLLWTNCQWRSTHSVGVTSSQDEFHLNSVSIILTASCCRPIQHTSLLRCVKILTVQYTRSPIYKISQNLS